MPIKNNIKIGMVKLNNKKIIININVPINLNPNIISFRNVI